MSDRVSSSVFDKQGQRRCPNTDISLPGQHLLDGSMFSLRITNRTLSYVPPGT